MSATGSSEELMRELRFALAEGDAEPTGDSLRRRVLEAAAGVRPPGLSSVIPEDLAGSEVFDRMVERMDQLLSSLAPAQWSAPALRELDVQGLVGHLIGVERGFADAVEGVGSPEALATGAEHVASTQPEALAQKGRTPGDTLRDWRAATARSQAAVAVRRPDEPVTFYGITLPLDTLLVVRAFELWTHEEDVERAVGVAVVDPEAAVLARMARLAVMLLPAGVAQVAPQWHDTAVRLVLTGEGGGTWDVAIAGDATSVPAPSARIVVDTATFCRVVADRLGKDHTGAVVSGDGALAAAVFAGAASLALD